MPSAQTNEILNKLQPNMKKGDLKKIAKEIKKNHALAMDLWSTENFEARLLSVLIMDKKLLTQELIDTLIEDISSLGDTEKNYISEWLLANQLMKDKKTKELLETWEQNPSPTLRRLFWYYQARLRWTGQTPPENTNHLLEALESSFATEEPEVQWAMNFTAGQIGVFDPTHRDKCIKLGEKVGLYKDEIVPKNCTPNYLPEFIRIEVAKKK